EQLSALSKQKASLLLLLFMPFGASYAQEIDMHGPSRGDQLLKSDEQGHQHQHNHVHTHDSAVQSENRPDLSMPVPSKIQDPAQFAASVKLSKSHAANFGSLLVQNFDGRIEPINTLALEILRKLHHKDQFYELDANQFLLSVSTQPFDWAQVPLIKVNAKGGPELLNRVKADPKGYTSLLNLITLKDNKATFVLEDEYQQAFAKKPADQNSYDKELIELNDKLQVMQYLISGQYLRVLPIPNDPNNTWVAWGSEHANHNTDVKNPFAAYLKEVIYAQTTQNWQQADQQLEKLKSL